MENKDAKYVAALRKIQNLLLRSEAEMEKSFQHTSNKSLQWLERLNQSQNVLTLCSNELCSWLSYWGLDNLEKTFRVLYHLHKTHLDYVLEGYMISLRRCENKGVMVTSVEPAVEEEDIYQKLHDDVVIKKKTKAHLNTVNVYEFKESERAREIEEAIQKFEDERVQRENAMKLEEEAARIDRVLNGSNVSPEDVGLSPLGIIDEGLGIVKRLVETHDKSTKQLETFLRDRKPVTTNDNIESLGVHLKDMLDDLVESDSGDSDGEDEKKKLFKTLEGKESLNNALNNIESKQKEIIMRALVYYKRIKNGVTVEKGVGPDLKIFDLDDAMLEKERLARTVAELEKDIRDKNSNMQSLKLSVQGKSEALDGNIGRIKTLEAKVAEYRSQVDLFKRELGEKSNLLYSQTEKVLKSQDQDKNMKELKDQLKATEEKLTAANKTISMLKEEVIYNKKAESRNLRNENRISKVETVQEDKKRKSPSPLSKMGSIKNLKSDVSESRIIDSKPTFSTIKEEIEHKQRTNGITKPLEDRFQSHTVRGKLESSPSAHLQGFQSPLADSGQLIHSFSENSGKKDAKKPLYSKLLPKITQESEETQSSSAQPGPRAMKSVRLLKPDNAALSKSSYQISEPSSPLEPRNRFQFKGTQPLDRKRAKVESTSPPKQATLTESLTAIIKEQIRMETIAQENSKERLDHNSEGTLLEEIHRRRIVPVRTMSMADLQIMNENPKGVPVIPKLVTKQLKPRKSEPRRHNQSQTFSRKEYFEEDRTPLPLKTQNIGALHSIGGVQVLDLTTLALEKSKSQVTVVERNTYSYKRLPNLRTQISETSRPVAHKYDQTLSLGGRSVSVPRGMATTAQNMINLNQAVMEGQLYQSQTTDSDHQPHQQSSPREPKSSIELVKSPYNRLSSIEGCLTENRKKKLMALSAHSGFADSEEIEAGKPIKTEEDEDLMGDRELEILYTFLRKDGANAGTKISMMRSILGGEKMEDEDSLDRKEADVEDIVALKTFDNFRTQVREWLKRHEVCGRDCKHLREFYKNIGYIRHILEHSMSKSGRRRKIIQIPVTVIGGNPLHMDSGEKQRAHNIDR